MTDRSDADLELASLESVSHGAVVSFFGLVLQKGLRFGTNLLLTHGLGASLYGVYALGILVSRMSMRVVSLGTEQSIVRFLPKYKRDPARQDRVLGLTYATTAVAGVALAAALAAFAPQINAMTIDRPVFTEVLRLFALMLPFGASVRVLGFLFRSLELIEYQAFVVRFARPGARLAAAAVALALGYSVVGVVAALVLATAAVSAVAAWLSVARTTLRPAATRSRREAAEFYNHALPTTMKQVGKLMQSRVDVVLIGFFLTAEAAGIYNVALLLTSLIAIPLISCNQLLPPIASDLHTEGNHRALGAVYSTVTRWVLTGAMLLAVYQVVFRAELLALFGDAYTRGAVVLTTFAVGRVVGSAVGATGWLLLMTDHQYLRMVNSWVLGGLNLGLSYYFVLEFGLVGAALGTAGSMALVNLVRLAELWYLEGLQPFTRQFAKPLGASAAMAACLFAVRPAFDGPTLLVVGGAAGVAVFFATLYALGVEPEDRRLGRSLYTRYAAGVRRETAAWVGDD